MYRYVPEMNLAYWANEYMISAFRGSKISDIAYVKEGLKTGDNERFIRYWTEVDINRTNIKMKIKKMVLSGLNIQKVENLESGMEIILKY